MFTLDIYTRGEAFQDCDGAPEIARILRKLALAVEIGTPVANYKLHDSNGYEVGKARWTSSRRDKVIAPRESEGRDA